MSDFQNQDPLLAPLGFNGGLAEFYTYPLAFGSPAINAGQNCVKDLTCAANNPPVAVTFDQRGAERDDNVDIGAFEISNSYVATLTHAKRSAATFSILVYSVGNYTYSVTAGSLAPGMRLAVGASMDIMIYDGTPTRLGTYNFSVRGNNDGHPTTTNYRMSVVNDWFHVPVSGKVVNASGNAVSKARVILTDQFGTARLALTNGFGYYYFDDVQTGGIYTVTVSAKQYSFAPQTVTIYDTYSYLNFTAAP